MDDLRRPERRGICRSPLEHCHLENNINDFEDEEERRRITQVGQAGLLAEIPPNTMALKKAGDECQGIRVNHHADRH